MDRFNCLLFTTRLDNNEVIYANTKAQTQFAFVSDGRPKLSNIISKASMIFYESYVKPLLIEAGECEEIQLTFFEAEDSKLIKVPCVANLVLLDESIHWSVHRSIERDKLFQELINTRDQLEKKAEELVLLTRIDPLTGLLNRRAIHQDIKKLSAQVERTPSPLSIGLIDIDHFKSINDTFGHDRGDEIISELALLLKNCTRASDLVARWGGEEFLIILYNCTLSESETFFDNLHNKVAKIEIEPGKKLSFSAGVVGFQPKNSGLSANLHTEFQHLTTRADEALYTSKNNGRSQTTFWQPPIITNNT
ncbi:MAG: GGDEF domain-containing protein [Pseudoalteromonas sp.]|nr:GGDEF domain-containing protein [Pseudoalteromonas sp.]